jgi:predicted TIM-barrel fold metal-dependent hydrolase
VSEPLVIDAHAHVLPHLGSAAGFASAAEHALYTQRAMHTHAAQPVRRERDHAIVTEPTLWDPDDPTPRGRREVGFRAAENGRFRWEVDGEGYYLQFMPPSFQTMDAPPDFMIAQMDYAGIDVAVLQNDHIYGALDDYFADAVARFPGRFVALAQVDEFRGYETDQLERLRRAADTLGFRGLYFTTSTFFMTGYQPYYDAPDFDPLWDEVARLGWPLFLTIGGHSPFGDFDAELARLLRWYERHPRQPTVLVHGLPDSQFLDAAGHFRPSDSLVALARDYPVYAELLFPIKWGGRWDYPYYHALDLVPRYRDLFGAERLLWGSDMPNVERYATYRQTLSYIRDYPSGLNTEELAAVLGGNAARLLGIERTRTELPLRDRDGPL